jgi:hypothetical protein
MRFHRTNGRNLSQAELEGDPSRIITDIFLRNSIQFPIRQLSGLLIDSIHIVCFFI